MLWETARRQQNKALHSHVPSCESEVGNGREKDALMLRGTGPEGGTAPEGGTGPEGGTEPEGVTAQQDGHRNKTFKRPRGRAPKGMVWDVEVAEPNL